MNAIYKFVLGLIGKRSGVVTTLPNQKQIEFQANILAEKFMQNGIDPNALKSPEQVKNVLANIDQANMRVIPADSAEGASISRGLGIAKKADVMDMKGNKINTSKGIMGGEEVPTSIDQESFLQRVKRAVDENKDYQDKKKAIDELENYTKSKEDIVQDLVDRKFGKGYFDTVDESDAAIKARLDADNKKGIESIKINLVDDSIAKIKSMEPMDAMKEANLVAGKKGKYANLDDNQVKKIMDDTEDHIFERDIPEDPEDFATGGRAGYKFGLGPLFNFLNKKSPAKAYTDYLKSVKDRVKAGKEAEVAGEVIPIAAGGALITNQLKKKLKAMNEEQKKKIKQEMEKKADGGRIGLKAGSVDKMRRLFLKTIGAGTAGIAGAKSGIFSFGKGPAKEVAKEVAQQTTTSTPPPYFFKLAEKIKMMGDDATATTDRTIAKTLKSKDGKSTYLLEEDVTTGDTIIKKINKEGDEMITDVEIMELKKGEVVMGKDGKPIKVPDEYEEVTEANARIEGDVFNDPYYTDGIQVDDIIKEVDDKVPSIKYASGGLAYMLGE